MTNPDFAQALEDINQGQWQRAFSRLIVLSKEHPEESHYRVKLSEVCLALNREQDAIKILKHLAAHLMARRQMAQAIAVGKRILEINPQDLEVQQQLEAFYAERPDTPENNWAKTQAKAREQVQTTMRTPIQLDQQSLSLAEPGDRVTWTAAEMTGTAPQGPGSGLELDGGVDLDRSVSGMDGFHSVSYDTSNADADLSVSPTRRSKTLPKIPLFSDLPPGPFSRLVSQCERQSIANGEVIIRQGDAGKCLYVLTYGRVRVFLEENFSEIPLAELGPGAFFGEMSYYSKGNREASVAAIEMGEILKIPYQVLDELLVEFPKVERALSIFYKERVLKNLFRRSEIFSSLSESDIDQVCQKFGFLPCKKGQALVKEGEVADRFFVIQRGRFGVYQGNPPQGIAQLQAGEFFGEYSLITGSPRNATVVALEDGMVLTLSTPGFKSLLQGRPQVIEKIRQLAKERLQSTGKKASI